ncbi:DUF5667 domain-containing protein [Haloplasma contractile]|uniref:DUF5667 domain-containing protein n=1 Tax=Haloplasma contractile SSD-17B TaxID=1033810 RepID=U2DY38_9MOLU|nr:DUF5667 domain-containing protein [Haloplasma contractile]ERJ13177.1 hypothetical protein HLPCO_000796 [Haloplasma contractile SSD-17B]
MKKMIVSVTIAGITTLGFGSVASASETIDTESVNKIEMPSAGIKPDSKLYGIDKLFEKLSLALSMSEEGKTEKLIDFAEERLAELNEMDESELKEFAESIYEDYGITLDQANEVLARLMSEGKISEDQLANIQSKLENASDLEEDIESDKLENVPDNVKDKVQEIKSKAYAIAIASGMDSETAKDLKDRGFGYGEIFKLQGIANLSGISVDELLTLDVFEEDEDGEQTIDFGKLTKELGLSMKDVMSQFKEIRTSMRNNGSRPDFVDGMSKGQRPDFAGNGEKGRDSRTETTRKEGREYSEDRSEQKGMNRK